LADLGLTYPSLQTSLLACATVCKEQFYGHLNLETALTNNLQSYDKQFVQQKYIIVFQQKHETLSIKTSV